MEEAAFAYQDLDSAVLIVVTDVADVHQGAQDAILILVPDAVDIHLCLGIANLVAILDAVDVHQGSGNAALVAQLLVLPARMEGLPHALHLRLALGRAPNHVGVLVT